MNTKFHRGCLVMTVIVRPYRFLLIVPLFIIASVLFLYSVGHVPPISDRSTSFEANAPGYARPDVVTGNPLDGCYHVYLDVGSNIGVQVRKLYEPQHYPDAPFVGLYEKTFGTPEERKKFQPHVQNTVCAVGFEPNPHHTKILKSIEHAYQKCGWNVNFMTETGVSNKNGFSSFYSDGAMAYKEWGGGILPPEVNNIALQDQKSSVQIKLLRLSQYLTEVVAKRKIPDLPHVSGSSIKGPKVLMKMDIEGSEIDVLPDILFNGGLGTINGLMIELHERLERLEARKAAHRKIETILGGLSDLSKSMSGVNNGSYSFEIVNIDDETYGTSDVKLPTCS